ncbi:MAG TPA: spore coat protein [Clostridia bacterium]|nr:spore coat protein [Clostridia bacterium]
MAKNQLSERDMLQDAIMTEKYVSSAYDTGIMESVNEEVMQTLQNIQQEEQNHAKLFFEVMNNRGWYDVQGAHINQSALEQINKQISYQLQNRIDEMTQKNQGQ